MTTVNPTITDKELQDLGWPPLVLQQLARDRAQIIADTVMELAENQLEWAPLRGMPYAEWVPQVDAELAGTEPLSASEFVEIIGDSAHTAAADLASYLALPADAGDDDAALVASVVAEKEEQPAEVDPEQVAREEQEAWDEREARVARAEARAEKRRERLAERLTARSAAREDGF